MKKISIEVPEALDRQIRVLAAQLDLNRSKFARLALQEKVERLKAVGLSGEVDEAQCGAVLDGTTPS